MKSNNNNKTNFVSYLLKTLNGKLVSNNTEIQCRCRYCPDSNNPSHAHFYIGIPNDSRSPFTYHCKLCDQSGAINSNTLLEWDIYDINQLMWVSNYNKYIPNNNRIKNRYKSDDKYNVGLNINMIDPNKLLYISNRIGYNITPIDALNLKIITNIKQCIDYNNLEYTRYDSILQILDKEFIGFLSYNNSNFNCRKIHDRPIKINSINKRYVNYRLFNDINTEMNTFYILPFSINIIQPLIRIHIAEGPFDILSIYLNLNNGNTNDVFMSCGGKSYIGALKFIINLLAIPNIEVHVYPDNEVSDYELRFVKMYCDRLLLKLYIHRNHYRNEKDYGVPRDRIKETIYLL